VVMAGLAGFAFVALMETEHKAIRARGQEQQLNAALQSAVEYLKVLVEQGSPAAGYSDQSGVGYGAEYPGEFLSDFAASGSATYWYDNPSLFRAVPLATDGAAGSDVRFSIVSARLGEEGVVGVRFGLVDESSRLNMLALVEWDRLQPGTGREALMKLPNMTESLADALLDWVDPDSTRRPFGAESDYYQSLAPPYGARNGRPESMEELLLVRDVTRSLLFGADVNRNYRVEANEQQMASVELETGGSGSLPWAELLTFYSAERNVSPDGYRRVNVNDDNLRELYDRLAQVLTEEQARFLIAYRQYGPYEGNQPASEEANVRLDFREPARYRLTSLLDVVDVKVRVPQGRRSVVLASPFTSDPGQLAEYLPRMLDYLSLTDAEVLVGRINVNLAPYPVLLAIPGMTADVAEKILASRGSAAAGNVAWLLTDNVVDLETMKRNLPYITARGDVYRAQIVAFAEPKGPVRRAEVVVDGTRRPARQVYWKELSGLGAGFALAEIGGGEAFYEAGGAAAGGWSESLPVGTGE